ncbi:MAG: hypothetical protein SOZ42_01025 [Candidatus Enterosoma sp.]|nr:hypothetical protein [Candidatus Enterosoma sp.]
MNRKFLKLFNGILNYCLKDKDFIDYYNKEKRKENLSYYLQDSIMDYLSNYNLLDKKYLDVNYLEIKFYKKSYLIDIDEIFQLFKDSIKYV